MVNVLAIGAHPDDIELGCSATLSRLKKQGCKIYLLILSKGEASGDPKIREKECEKSAELLGAEKLFFGGLEDTKISDGVETINVIDKIIEEVNADIIYTHSAKDTHQDHRKVAYASLSAGRRIKKIFMYESPRAFREFLPQIYVDVDDEIQLKNELISLFPSQHSKEWWSIGPKTLHAWEGLAAYRGFQAGVKWAEAFEVGRLVISKNESVIHVINSTHI
jgi:LmbE family N-acetylglucosaminyl deacetylase